MKFKLTTLIGRSVPPEDDSAFAKFIRDANSSEKKKVYKRVLERATERQKKVLEKTG